MRSPAPDAPAPSGAETAEPVEPQGFWARIRFHLLTPWWRGALFFGAIAWGIAFNIAYFVTEPRIEFLGVVSLIPMFMVIIAQQARSRARLRARQAAEATQAAQARTVQPRAVQPRKDLQ